jgi:peroxiredoxin (alkyl hydroperoxide reductase subunit C)
MNHGDNVTLKPIFRRVAREGILRAMVYYRMSNGRSIPEFLRLVKALQTSDANGVATPRAGSPATR